jgi:hypothetical protein
MPHRGMADDDDNPLEGHCTLVTDAAVSAIRDG